ncbi:MAG: glycine dehydrogenase subunit 2 [Calditrichaeota bacterium]|nr:glycine dehydrogenase subunit 2 [Calditrichota bacterium]
MYDKVIFELSVKGRRGYTLPKLTIPQKPITDILPDKFLRKEPPVLPEVSEPDVVRHFVQLSNKNYHLDKGFYPLGSCTMKYNPKVNETVSALEGFAAIHPHQDEEDVQGALQLMYELSEALCEISGMKAVTLQPAAGAHGELTGMMMVRAFHEKQGNPRKKVLLPDSAHGTNPASSVVSGYQAVQIKSDGEGLIDLDMLKENLDEEVAALMVTNPNTLGLFESRIQEVKKQLDEVGALLYMDGANLNALLGIVRPGDLGVDVMHFNLHKTFSTPHGGGGPGSGPVGVSERLVPFLPVPRVEKAGEKFRLGYDYPDSIGKVQAFYGNFSVMVKALTYIRMLGSEGLKRVSRHAILNANYLLERVKSAYDLPYPRRPMHEFVLSGDRQKKNGIKTLDIAKRLLDLGFHAPTVYFPLIVHEALMIEPTETESKQTLDAFAEALLHIAREVDENPDRLKQAPVTTPVGRLNEALAARQLQVKWTPEP